MSRRIIFCELLRSDDACFVLQVLLTEAYTSLPNTIKYYNFGSDVPFNFKFITDVNKDSSPDKFQNLINDWISRMPNGSVANWVVRRTLTDSRELISRQLLCTVTASSYLSKPKNKKTQGNETTDIATFINATVVTTRL